MSVEYEILVERQMHKPDLFVTLQKDAPTVGIQSKIDKGTYMGEPAIRKTCGEELYPSQRQLLVDAIPAYRRQLLLADINIPKNFQVRDFGGMIETTDRLIFGDDIDMMLRTGNVRATKAWEEMVKVLLQAQGKGNESRAMLDAKPANFVLDATDTLWYVDTFPPAVRAIDGGISPYIPELYKRPRELFTFNYGDTRGQFVKLLAGTKMTYPAQYEQLKELTLDTIELTHPSIQMPQETFDFIKRQADNDFPIMKELYSGNLEVLKTI